MKKTDETKVVKVRREPKPKATRIKSSIKAGLPGTSGFGIKTGPPLPPPI